MAADPKTIQPQQVLRCWGERLMCGLQLEAIPERHECLQEGKCIFAPKESVPGSACAACKGPGFVTTWVADEADRSGQSDHKEDVTCPECDGTGTRPAMTVEKWPSLDALKLRDPDHCPKCGGVIVSCRERHYCPDGVTPCGGGK